VLICNKAPLQQPTKFTIHLAFLVIVGDENSLYKL